jgi:hypothetical protein
VSLVRWRQNRSQTREVFTENAMRRGLGARDRQILRAIVMRSGLRRSQEVFTAGDAFDRGALKLLAEFMRSRTPAENEQLRSEIGRLRERLGFQIASPAGDLAGLGQTSSREIPPGRTVELRRAGAEGEIKLRGEVIRNDEIEFAVRLPTAIESRWASPGRSATTAACPLGNSSRRWPAATDRSWCSTTAKRFSSSTAGGSRAYRSMGVR